MMETFKYNLLNNWNVIRIIRMVLSIVIIMQAIQIHDLLFGSFGVFFMYQALNNTGCCMINACTVTTNEPLNSTKETEFTEIKNLPDGIQH